MSAPTTATTRGRDAEDADDDANVPEHLRCSICLDAPASTAQQCFNGGAKAPGFPTLEPIIVSMTN
jgi:hypothetical protein